MLSSYTPTYIFADHGVWAPPAHWDAWTLVSYLQDGTPELPNKERPTLCVMTDGTLHAFALQPAKANRTLWNKLRTKRRVDVRERDRAYHRDIVNNPNVQAVLMSCTSSDCTYYVEAVLPYSADIPYLVKHFKQYFQMHHHKEWYTRGLDQGILDMESTFVEKVGPTPPPDMKGAGIVDAGRLVDPQRRQELQAAGGVIQPSIITKKTMCLVVAKPLPDMKQPWSKKVKEAVRRKIPLVTPHVLGKWMDGSYSEWK